jgi:hypothetical protein
VVSFTALSLYRRGKTWVVPRNDLDIMEKRENSWPSRELNPDFSLVQLVAWLLYRLN